MVVVVVVVVVCVCTINVHIMCLFSYYMCISESALLFINYLVFIYLFIILCIL